MNEDSLENERQYLEKQAHKSLKKALSSRERGQENLNRCHAWDQMAHQGELLKANFHLLKRGMESVTVHDYEQDKEITIALNPRWGPKEQVEQHFRTSKKLKRGIANAEKHLAKIDKEISSLQMLIETIAVAPDAKSLEQLRVDAKISPPTMPKTPLKAVPPSPYLHCFTASGDEIIVAKNARDNDKLTHSYARGSDWWFHVADAPGAHVILRLKHRDDPPDSHSIQDAALVAFYHSKAKNQADAEVHMTQCKYVSKVRKGKPGLAQISKHRRLIVRADLERYKALRANSTLPRPPSGSPLPVRSQSI